MNAIGSPAAAVPADSYTAPDRRDWLKLAGGMMFGAGVIVLLARKGQDWSDWAIFAVLLIGALILLGLGAVQRAGEELGGWRTGFLVFGTLLLLASFLQLVNAADGRPGAPLNIAWTFGLAGAVAVITSLVLRAHVQMLVGALFGLIAWLGLWTKILDNPSGDTVRWLLIVLAVIYIVVAFLLSRARPGPAGYGGPAPTAPGAPGAPGAPAFARAPGATHAAQASDLITVAGIAAVLAAIISLAGAAQSVISSGGGSPGGLPGGVPKPGQGWNVFLLVVSLVLIAYSSRGATRGPGYVGAVGLAGFIGLTGLDLVNRFNGHESGGVVGWPLILLIGGGILIAAGFVLRPGSFGGPGSAASGGPGGPGYGAPAPGYGAPQVGAPGAPGSAAAPGAPRAPGPAGAPGAPGAPGLTQPGVAQPPPPGQAPQGGQEGGLLDQWRQQPPPGGGPPPGQ